MAGLLGLTQTGYSAIEKGKAKLSIEDLITISEDLGIDLGDLTYKDGITLNLSEEEVVALAQVINKIQVQISKKEIIKETTTKNSNNTIIGTNNFNNSFNSN